MNPGLFFARQKESRWVLEGGSDWRRQLRAPLGIGRTAMRTAIVLFGLCFSLALWGAETPRVYIEDSQSWEMKGGVGGTGDAFGGTMSGGARPQTAEIMKTFSERCGNNIIINNRK